MCVRTRVLAGLVVWFVVLLVVSGCAIRRSADNGARFPVTVTDDAGRKVTLGEVPKRIVSLTPANTEILFALGLGDKVVGVTTFCDYPREAKKKAKIGDFMNPNIEKIVSLDPDLVLATSGVQQALVDALDKAGVKLYVSDPRNMAGVMANLGEIGRMTGRESEAAAVTGSMQADIKEVKERVQGLKRPSVFYEVSYDPLYTAGRRTFIDDIITTSRGVNVAAAAGEGYVVYGLESLIKEDPDIYLVVQGSMNDPKQLESRAGYDALSAVRGKRVHMVDDNLVSRPGPRITKGLRQVAEFIHPEAFK